MSAVPLTPSRPHVVSAGRLLAWWGALALLLLGEVLFLTVRFDATRFATRTDLPGRVVAFAPEVLRIAIASAVACLVLAVWRVRFGGILREVDRYGGGWPWLVVHLTSFVWLVHASTRALGPESHADGPAVLAWLCAVACSGVSWLAAAVSPRVWPWLVWNGRGVWLAGVAVGLGSWSVGQLAQSGWRSSAAPTFHAVEQLLRVVYPEVVSDPDRFVLGTPAFCVRIAPECSGYEGVCLVCVYLAAYLAFVRHELRFPRALWLLPVGAAAAWLLNIGRIALLIVIGDQGSPDVALGGFHSQAGWLAFNAVALGLTFVAHRSHVFRATTNAAEANPAAVYLVPLLTLVLVRMLTDAFGNGSATLYPLRVLAGIAVLVYFRRSITVACQWTRGGVWPAVLAGVGVFVMWIGLDRLMPAGDDPRAALAGLSRGALVVWVVCRVVGSVLIVPLAEELAFRGYLLRRLIASDFEAVSPRRFTRRSFALSSLLFGLLHGQWMAGTAAGMVYAVVLYRRGRLADAVVAHATTNALLAVTALVSGDWRHWS